MNSHKNFVFCSKNAVKWFNASSKEVVLGIAPVFHITGLMTNVGMVWATGCSVVLPYRFHPVLIAHLVEKYKCTFTTAAITAFTALLNDKQCSLYNFSSFSKVYSGGGFFPFLIFSCTISLSSESPHRFLHSTGFQEEVWNSHSLCIRTYW